MHFQRLHQIMHKLIVDGEDLISKADFTAEVKSRGYFFPEDFIRNFIADVQADEATLSYKRFISLVHVFYSLPVFRRGESNNSDNFKRSQNLDGANTSAPLYLKSLLRTVYAKIEEKYSKLSAAFRAFDLNGNGFVEFNEFMEGLETLGVFITSEEMK